MCVEDPLVWIAFAAIAGFFAGIMVRVNRP